MVRHERARYEEKTEVSSHFNQPGHSVEDMRISGVYHVPDENERFIKEQRLIAQLGAFRGEGMNIDFRHMHLVDG